MAEGLQVDAASIEQVSDSVYEVVAMPAVDYDQLVSAAGSITSKDRIATYMWYVYVNGEKVYLMDAEGKLADGVARVLWVSDVKAARASLDELISDESAGKVVVITSTSKIGIEVVTK